MGDLISRQAVINMVKGWKLNQHIMNEEDALDDVNELPSQESVEAELQGCDRCALKGEKCAEEYRQLVERLKELKRARYLLKVSYDLLRKQEESLYVLNILSETIFYDGAECDGYCLMEDINNFLEYGV